MRSADEMFKLPAVRRAAAPERRGLPGTPIGPLLAVTRLLALLSIFVASPALRADDPGSPLERALDYLYRQQVRQPLAIPAGGQLVVDFPGDWPQYVTLQGQDGLRVRDVSPFTVVFIHHALTHVVAGNRHVLGLSQRDIRNARVLRRRAVSFVRTFASPAGAADAGTFAFWPYDADPDVPDLNLTLLLMAWLQGPILGGERVPINLRVYPVPLAIPSDADVTATSYATLLDDAVLDGGPGSDIDFAEFFVDWRDLGVVPRRLNPAWLPPASGAFLTWLTYRERTFPSFPNDVDLVVNANVLYALGRYGKLDTPGVAESVGYINLVTALGLHRGHLDEISEYYPDNLAFQYMVSRAFREGGVSALAPAVAILADDLEASVLIRPDGTAYWDLGDPQLNTAFAVLTLINADRDTPVTGAAIRYLVSAQNASGGFDEATFFIGRTDGGQVFEFTSASFTTALALEAFARYELYRAHYPGAVR